MKPLRLCEYNFSFIHSGVLLSSIGRLYLMQFLANVCFTLGRWNWEDILEHMITIFQLICINIVYLLNLLFHLFKWIHMILWLCPNSPTAHWFDSPLVRQPIASTAHWSDSPLLRQPIGPTTHCFDNQYLIDNLFCTAYCDSKYPKTVA